MVKIREIMVSTENLLIQNVNFKSIQGLHTNNRGNVTADCYARSRGDVQEFTRRLRDAGYDVKAPVYQTGSRDPNYSTEVQLDMNIPIPAEDS